MLAKKFFITIFMACCLSACQQTSKLDPENTAMKSPPKDTIENQDLGKQFLWGGEIIKVENLESTTELTIIGYPLDRYEKPKYKQASSGRFIAVYTGFLEPTDYSKGNLVSVKGNLIAFRAGKVAQADYNFPVIEIDKLDLKGKTADGYHLPFSIGIGIGF